MVDRGMIDVDARTRQGPRQTIHLARTQRIVWPHEESLPEQGVRIVRQPKRR